jgi:protein-disulfide isomerase
LPTPGSERSDNAAFDNQNRRALNAQRASAKSTAGAKEKHDVSRNQIVLLGGAVAAIVLAVIAYFAFFSEGSDSANVAVGDHSTAIVVSTTDVTLGSPNAPVKVLEYGAPSCPVCARFEMDNFDQLKKTYIDTGKVYFIFRVFPINGAADGAAEGLARCAGRTSADNYFHFLDLLFRNQKDWDPEITSDVRGGLLKVARIGGIEAEAETCMADKANADRINTVSKDAVARYNVNATPTLVVNGVVQQPGYMPWAQLKSMLDSFLARKHG